jgi:TolB-like protein/DNA-binding winged helix-turn-helix (wHTH) protein
MDVFVCLAAHANELVTREELQEAVWGGRAVTDEPLTRAIGELRRALEDGGGDSEYIETVPKRGYRLIGEILLPDGSRLESDQTHSQPRHRKLAVVIVAALALALVYAAYDVLVIDPAQEQALRSDASDLSVAVLPFVSVSSDPEQEYFADGLSEDILSLLARIPGLKVVGRTSSFVFKGKNEDLRVIGQTLGVKTVLEGSVRKSGDRLRITAQLIDVSDGTHIWSETYDRTMTDIFEVQDEVATAIIDTLQIHVGAAPSRGRPTDSPEAYTLFLKARVLLSAFEQKRAEELLLEAIKLDPNFAEAYELLASAYWALNRQRRTYDAAAKALAIEPDLVLAQALYDSANVETHLSGVEAFERALRERPGDPHILGRLSWNLAQAGYLQEVLRLSERRVNLDPLSLDANIDLAWVLYAVGRVNEAVATMELAGRLTPKSTTWMIGIVNLVKKQDEIAIANFEEYLRHFGYADSSWVRELVTAARDPATGQAYLDRRIPQIVASMSADEVLVGKVGTDWHNELTNFYLFFGFLDRYFEQILDLDLTDSAWTGTDLSLYQGALNAGHRISANRWAANGSANKGQISLQRDRCSRCPLWVVSGPFHQ